MSFFDKLRTQKLLSFTLMLFTLSIGIVIGTLVNSGVKAARDNAAAQDATPLVIPNPVELSNSFSQLAKQVEPSVVNISTTYNPRPSRTSLNRRGRPAPQDDDDQDNNGYFQIYGRGFTFAGAQRIALFTVNTVGDGQQYAPAVATDGNGDFVVGWEDDQDDNGAFQILGRGFNPSGTQRKADFTVNSDSSGQQYVPAVAIFTTTGFPPSRRASTE